MTAEKNRYQRDKERREAEAQHQRIVDLLSGDIIEDYEAIKASADTNCDTGQFPNKWVDWDVNPEHAEDYEVGQPVPSEEQARDWCQDCPLMVKTPAGQPLCYAYARATNQSHGVWGGIRIYDGKRLGWGETRV